MKKSFLLTAAACAAPLFFTACSSKKAAEAKQQEQQAQEQTAAQQANEVNKVIGAEGIARPDWVMGGMEAPDGVYAVGSAKFSNMQNSLKAARANGRAELANTVQASVKSAITTYAEDTGLSADTLNYMEQATVQKTDSILVGSTQKDYWVGPDETVYVLMYLPYTAVVPAANNVIKDYIPDAKTELTVEKVQAAVEKYKLNN